MIKDTYCTMCGHERPNLWVESIEWTEADWPCSVCNLNTVHRAVCNGGSRLKCYAGSYDGRDWSGDSTLLDVEATYADGTPYLEKDGKPTHDRFKSGFKDRIDEKRKILKFNRKKENGLGKIFSSGG